MQGRRAETHTAPVPTEGREADIGPISRGTTLVAARLSHATTYRLRDAQRGSQPPAKMHSHALKRTSLSCIVAIRSWAAFDGSCPDSGLPPFAGSLAGNTHLLFPLNAGCVVVYPPSHAMCESGNDLVSLVGDTGQAMRAKSVRLHSVEMSSLGGCIGRKERIVFPQGNRI